MDEVLSSFGRFDVPSESLKYIGGVTAHFLQRQKEQEIKHIAENYILIKQAIVHESDSMRRGMMVEKLKQLEQIISIAQNQHQYHRVSHRLFHQELAR